MEKRRSMFAPFAPPDSRRERPLKDRSCYDSVIPSEARNPPRKNEKDPSPSARLGMTAMTPEFFIRLLDEAYEKRAWHGPNLRGSFRGVSAEQAVWRPEFERHNIQEMAVHCAYWKYAVRRKLTGEKRGSFPRKGSNWFLAKEADEKQWREDLKLLSTEHRALREAVLEVPPQRLRDMA